MAKNSSFIYPHIHKQIDEMESKTTQMVARETESCYGWRYLFKNKLNKKAAKGGMLVLLGRFYEVDVKQHTVSYAWNESCYEGRFVYENKLSKMMTCLMTCSLMILNTMKATIISMDMMLSKMNMLQNWIVTFFSGCVDVFQLIICILFHLFMINSCFSSC